MQKLEDLITDIVSQVADISFVGTEVQEVKDGTRRRFDDDLLRAEDLTFLTSIVPILKDYSLIPATKPFARRKPTIEF